MPLYSYQAFSSTGKKRRGSVDASSRAHARQKLQQQGLYPITVDLTTPDSSGEGSWWSSLFAKRLAFQEKISFTKQLRVLLGAGVPVVDALDLIQQQNTGHVQRITVRVRDAIKEGGSLADGLALYQNDFGTIYIQLVRAGEATGSLEVVLDRLGDYLVRQEELRKKVKGALTYPLFQLVAIVAVVAFLMMTVVPQLVTLFGEEGTQLPLATRIVKAISDIFVAYGLIGGIALVVVYAVYRAWRATPSGARTFDAFVLKLPGIGYFARRRAVVQFTRTLGLLIENGVNLAEALDIVCTIVDNRILVSALETARHNIIRQGKVAEYLRQTDIFPPTAIYLIQTGEQSGELGKMLQRVGEQYEKELQETSDTLSARLGPIMLLIMAGIVGFIVVAIIAPMGQFMQKLSIR